MLKLFFLILFFVSSLFSNKHDVFITEIFSIFSNKQDSKNILKYYNPRNVFPKKYILLKLKEGQRKKIKISFLKLTAKKLLTSCNQFYLEFSETKNLKLKKLVAYDIIYNYLVDFVLQGVSTKDFCQILNQYAHNSLMSKKELFELFEVSLNLLSSDISNLLVTDFLRDFTATSSKSCMIKNLSFYFTYVEINQMDMVKSLKFLNEMKSCYSKKRMVSFLKDRY